MAAELRERERLLSDNRRNTRTQINPEDFEEEDDNWRGLRGNSMYGGSVQSAMGWVVFEFPEEKLVNRVIVYTIDSEKYPAKKYGVNHIRLQYWTPQAKGWQNVRRFGKGKGQQFDSIRDIETGKVIFRFEPVKTSKLRLVILWTNDSERYKLGYFQYARGTIRLVEVEIYGLEKRKEPGTVVSADESELSKLLEETKPDESDKRVVPSVDVQTNHKPKSLVSEANTVEATIRSYERAYQNKDLASLMSTISLDYFRDGETYQQLESKMQNLFHSYENIDFTLQRLNIEQTAQDAKVEANYSLRLEGSGVKANPYSGKLFFNLSNTNGRWKITQISTKR
jgi:ketosteroid isomerase-like protein